MLEEIIAERDKNWLIFRDAETDPYPASVKRTLSAAAAVKNFGVLSKAKNRFL